MRDFANLDAGRTNGMKASGCGCCLSRRHFLTGCAACAAGAAALTRWAPRALAAEGGKKLRIRAVFSHPTPQDITWPNIGYDYEARAGQMLSQLGPLCPGMEFLPVHSVTPADVKKVLAEDGQVDAYLMVMLGMRGTGPTVAEALGKAGRPMVMVEDQYAGPYSLGFNGRAEKAGWKAVGLATSRIEDVAAVVNCLQILAAEGGTAEKFLAEARAAFKKNIAKPGDLSCPEDKVQIAPMGQVLEKLRNSTILVVGREAKGVNPVTKEFGTKVVGIGFPELHDAWAKADPAAAAAYADRWIKGAGKMLETNREEVVKSGAMQVAMQELMKKHNAQAITIHCLGGFYGGHLKAYPCLGFVELNNIGQVGACEADLSSTITMLAGTCLSGRAGYISDPVIDTAKNQIIYAHCVAPTKVFGPGGEENAYHIRSHSEDRRGAAVRSLLPLGYMTTTLKFMPGQKTAVLHQGKSVENIDDDRACRTKLAVEVKGDIEKLFCGWSAGWHRVTFYGDLKEPFAELCKALNIKMVEEA